MLMLQCNQKYLVPQMIKRGYSAEFSAAITAASSAVSPVIPPGIDLIIYSLISGVSVGKMFIAGYTPGIIMSIALMITVHIISVKRNYKPSRTKLATVKEFFVQFVESIWSLLIPFGIIMGMRFGLFTPTEAGGIAVLFSFLVGFIVYKGLKLSDIPLILKDTIYGTGAIMILIASAKVFGIYLNLEQIPQEITNFLVSLNK